MFEIVPVSITQVDWNAFVTGVNTAIGRSPTRELDKFNKTAGTIDSYIPALGEFEKKGTTPVQAWHNDVFLRHMHLGVFCATDRETLHQILIHGQNFSIVMSDPGRMKEHYIITASMETWRDAIINSCQSNSPPESREFFNKMWILLDKLGFREMFHTHRRHDLKDGTFKLEARK